MSQPKLYKLPGITQMIDITAPIIPNGSFNWTEATKEGFRLPENADQTAGIIMLAKAIQPWRHRLGRPLVVTSWYRTPKINREVGGVSNSLHLTGKAMDCYCDSLSASALYDFFDPDWKGGLGLYSGHVHLDVGRYTRF